MTPMEGYSVTEAASVLGVPTERVWELLARGILAGTPEGETGMRVHLQPRATVVPGASASDPARQANGGDDRDRAREPEGSPFRELLSEFRNLTERYGQALLALGEARGEVASLRSRVDLLEARIDLRLPGPMPQPATPAPSSWRGEPAIVEPADAPPAEAAAVVADEEPEPEADRRGRRRRGRGQHRATDDIAEALARADDPSPAELPGASEASAALAALRAETARERPQADVLLPHEVAAAEPIPAVEPEPARDAPADVSAGPTAPPSVEEAAPAPPAAVDAAPPTADPVTAEAVSADPVTAEAMAGSDTTVDVDEARAEPDDAPVTADTDGSPAAVPATPAESAESAESIAPDTEAAPEAELRPAIDEAGTETPEPTWDRDRYTTSLGEPDWIPEVASPAQPGAPPSSAAEEALATPEEDEAAADDWSAILGGWEPREAADGMTGFDRWPEEEETPVTGVSPQARGSWPATDATGPLASEAPPPPAVPEPETAAQAQAEAASEMEVAPPSAERLPTEASRPTEPPAHRTTGPVPASQPIAPSPLATGTPRPSVPGGPTSAGSGTMPGTASRAYRRLRRIFPG